jgi:hypothetical protein
MGKIWKKRRAYQKRGDGGICGLWRGGVGRREQGDGDKVPGELKVNPVTDPEQTVNGGIPTMSWNGAI